MLRGIPCLDDAQPDKAAMQAFQTLRQSSFETASWTSAMIIPIRLAGLRGSEEARLVLVNEAVAAVLVRLLPEPNENPEDGWYLHAGFGPCNREGLIFSTLEAAEAWTRGQFSVA